MWYICAKYMCALVHLHVEAKVPQLKLKAFMESMLFYGKWSGSKKPQYSKIIEG